MTRFQDCLALRVKDIDFDRHQIVVRRGKGQKDVRTMLPAAVRGRLQAHLEEVKRQHERDLARGGGRAVLPFALDRKYPNASTDWAWQFVFPAARICRDPQWGPPSLCGTFLAKCPAAWKKFKLTILHMNTRRLQQLLRQPGVFCSPHIPTWHLEHYEHSDSNTVDHLVYQLTRTESTDDHILACYESLSPTQVQAVAAFLPFIATQSYDS